MRRQFIAAPLLIGVWVSAAAAQDTTTQMRTDMPVAPQSDTAVLAQMHATNQLEIRLGNLAQRNASSAQVKSFGQRLVRDHSAADRRVTELAGELGVQLKDHGQHDQAKPARDSVYRMRDTAGQHNRPDSAQRQDTGQAGAAQGKMQEHAQLEQRLESLRGTAFDSAFARAMVQGHQEAIAMLETAQQQVENEEVKSLIASTLPTLREHLRMAQSLASGAVTSSSER